MELNFAIGVMVIVMVLMMVMVETVHRCIMSLACDNQVNANNNEAKDGNDL